MTFIFLREKREFSKNRFNMLFLRKLKMQKSCTLLLKQYAVSANMCCSGSVRSQSQHAVKARMPFVIPERIERGPTDILKALASTVKRDPTASHYKYHDDPFFIPITSVGKRQFALSQEAGRKAARWVKEEHSRLFNHKLADPYIQPFGPSPQYNENSEVSNEVLRKVIERQEVSNAVLVHELMKSKDLEIHPAVEQSLLELLCFYNSEDAVDSEDVEERWFLKGTPLFERPKNKWSDSSYAEKLFHSMKEKTSEAYCAMIQGMAAYNEAERGWMLYEEMRENKMPLTTDTFNSVMTFVPFMREEGGMRWELLQDVVQEMVTQGLRPNLGTLNAMLLVLSKIGLLKISLNYSLAILTEFRMLGIEPSLASFYHILKIHYGKRVSGSTLLIEMIKYLEDLPEIKVQDPEDINFFFKAMEAAHEKHVDKELGHRIHALLSRPGNESLIGDSFRESLYFRHYFQLIAKTETIDNLMAFYHTLVPNVYNPDSPVVQDIIASVDLHGSINYLPQIWSDIRSYERSHREELGYLILSTMAKNIKPLPEDAIVSETDKENRLRLLKSATDIWTNLDDSGDNGRNKLRVSTRPPPSWSGEPLGHLISIFLRLGAFSRACKIIEKLDREGATKVSGFPKAEDLKSFLEACKNNSQAPHALATINYAVEIGYQEADEMAAYVAASIPMDESQRNKLCSIIGKDLFKDV